MKLDIIKKDLFDLPKEYALIHCISLDCEMGKGIAKVFDKKFKGMKKEIKETVNINHINEPTCIMYYEGEDWDNQKVINMITKECYWNKPTYEDFECSLDSVVSLCDKYNINKIGMPYLIGCGLDRLSEVRVLEMVKDKFKDVDIEILICKKNKGDIKNEI